MGDVIADYCAFHHAYNHISPARARDQERVLRRLEAFLPGAVTELTARELERFLATLEVAPSTTLKYLKMLRPFFKWLYRERLITAEQRIDLLEVKAPRGAAWTQPKPYSRREIAELWEHLDHSFPWTTDTDIRHHSAKRAEFWVRRWQRGASQWHRVYPYARRLQLEAIIALALYGGLRRVEIFQLELVDMHYESAYLRVTGAAKNPAGEPQIRAVPMTDPMRLALANWIEFRAQVLQPGHDSPWLCLHREKRLEPMTFGVLAHLLDKVGEGYELHRLRHTYATERLRAGMAVEKLQPILGHTNIQQTLRYAKIGVEDVLRAAAETDQRFGDAFPRDPQ